MFSTDIWKVIFLINIHCIKFKDISIKYKDNFLKYTWAPEKIYGFWRIKKKKFCHRQSPMSIWKEYLLIGVLKIVSPSKMRGTQKGLLPLTIINHMRLTDACSQGLDDLKVTSPCLWLHGAKVRKSVVAYHRHLCLRPVTVRNQKVFFSRKRKRERENEWMLIELCQWLRNGILSLRAL